MRFPKPSKFRNVLSVYNGVRYHSKKEAEFAQGLDFRLSARGPERIKSWRRQVRIPLVVDGIKICIHVVDFEITYPDGSVELVEVKGYPTALWKLKRKLLEATYLKQNPEIKYTIV